MIALGAFLVAVVASFLPWYTMDGGVLHFFADGKKVPLDSLSINGLKFTAGIIYFIAALIGMAAAGTHSLLKGRDIRRYATFGIIGAAGVLLLSVSLALTENPRRGFLISSGEMGLVDPIV